MKSIFKDPLFLVSVLLAITGTIQASTSMLSVLATKYPTAFGLAITGVSIVTAVLTAIKTQLLTTARPDGGQNSGV